MEVEALQIRRAEPDDYSDIFEIFNCPGVIAGTLQLPYPSRERWRQRLNGSDEGTYSLVAVIGDRVVGMIDVHTFPNHPRRRHVGEIGMCVHDEWQGKGIGKALMQAGVKLSDNWLNLRRLELEVYTDNEPAIRLYERFGFQREGMLRQHAFRNGSYVDSFLMARLHQSSGVS